MKTTIPRPIIVKRKKKVNSHHGGAWKIAFADFMTAMMALFLVLWIIALADPITTKSIAEYFRTPLVVALAGGDRDTASTSAIPGGGPDPAYHEGEVRMIDLLQESRSNQERDHLLELKRILTEAFEIDDKFKDIQSQIIIDLIPEGLRIQLVDSEQRPMFEVGSAVVAPYMKDILQVIAPILNDIPNSLQISGHTDSRPYMGGYKGYSNWELSSDRANASRREMVAGGLNNQKLIRVSGMSDMLPFDQADKDMLDSRHRRIAIIVMDRYARHRILNQEHRLIMDELGLPAAVNP